MWVYTQVTCDVWQVAGLCNYMAGRGWEPVMVFETLAGVKVPRQVSVEDGESYTAVMPHEVLFRRLSDERGTEE